MILTNVFCITMALLGGVTVFVLAMSLRRTIDSLIRTNTQLMILVGSKEGGEPVARALVALEKEPKKVIPGLAQTSNLEQAPTKPYVMTVGAR